MTIHLIVRGRNVEPYLAQCLASVKKQTYKNWRIWLILDAPTDNSEALAKQIKLDWLSERGTNGLKFSIITNTKRMGLGYNIHAGISFAEEQSNSNLDANDVIAFLDADDKLFGKEALSVVARTYEKYPRILCTYGSFVNASTKKKTKTSRPYPGGAKVRLSKWHGSHLFTHRYWLWKHLPSSYLQDKKGNWAEAASDRARSYAIMELAGLDRCRHISKVLYVYRDKTPYTCDREQQKRWDKKFRAKKSLKRI